MSDKSFGDHTNRNIVKNPLLLSAVTGLSLEDLTHKAVLLPAAPSQTLITRSVQSGPQQCTLSDTDNAYQSGDANYNIHPPINTNILTENATKHEQKKLQNDFPTIDTVSKASQKSQDDFDVNEYFARLQGTRYVSAPLHSHMKEDNTTSLQATEENLEEINLNEPEKVEQQSLTADIAQNFSQLPNVLPHVANAVFSSFSNMLSYKSREQTPDGAKGVRHEMKRDEAVAVPLMGVEEVAKEVAPPPKESSVIGPGSYRITTKKKVYAQIPGLSSGEQQNQPFNTQPNQNIHYFTPEQPQVTTAIDNENIFRHVEDNPVHTICDSGPHLQEICESTMLSTSQLTSQAILPPPPTFANTRGDSETRKVVLPPSVARRISGNHPLVASQTVPALSIPENIFTPAPISNELTQSTSTLDVSSTAVTFPSQESSSVTMFPVTSSYLSISENTTPMFQPSSPMPSSLPYFQQNQASNIVPENYTSAFPEYGTVATDYNQTVSDKQLSNIPTVPNVMGTPETDKINPIASNTIGLTSSIQLQGVSGKTSNIPTQIEKAAVGFVSPCQQDQPLPPPPMGNASYSIFKPQETPLSKNTPESVLPSGPVLPPTSNNPPSSYLFATSAQTAPATNIGQNTFQPKPYAPRRKIGSSSTNIPPSSLPQNITIFNPSSPDVNVESNITPSELSSSVSQLTNVVPNIPMFAPHEIKQDDVKPPVVAMPFNTSSNVTLFTPNLSQPSEKTQNIAQQYTTTSEAQVETILGQQLAAIINPNTTIEEAIKPAEPPKGIVSNFRMIKKKPQYYSGPIQGVGSISNNVKPLIPQVEAPSFSGNLYDPQQNIPDVNPLEQTRNVQDYFSSKESCQDISKPQISSVLDQPLYYPNRAIQSEQSQSHNLKEINQPFDITQTIQTPFDGSSPFDINQQTATNIEPQTYNTAFDLSRATTEAYDAKYTKGFGLIGSLKSKLSSLDINKIQNTVTTFFDPAYNEAKKEIVMPQENEPYRQIDQTLQSNFEIFVPTTQTYENPNYGQNYYQQDPHNYYQPTYQVSDYNTNSYATSQINPSCLHNIHDEATPLLSTFDRNQPEVVSEFKQIPIGSHLSTAGPMHTVSKDDVTNISSNNTYAHCDDNRVSQEHFYGTNIVPEKVTPKRAEECISTFPRTVSRSSKFELSTEQNLQDETVETASARHENIAAVINEESKDAILKSMDKTQEAFIQEDIKNISSQLTNIYDPRSALNFFDIHSSSQSTKAVISEQSSMFTVIKPLSYIADDKAQFISQDTRGFKLNSDETVLRPECLEVCETATYTHTPDLITGLFSKVKDNVSDSTCGADFIMSKKDLDSSFSESETVEYLDVTKVITDLPPVELFSKFKEKEPHESQCKSLLESITQEEMPIVRVSSEPLFGLSTIIADKSKEITELEVDVKNMSLFENQSVSLFDKNTSVSFFENTCQYQKLAQNGDDKNTLFDTGSHKSTIDLQNINQSSHFYDENVSDVETCKSYAENWEIKDSERNDEDDVTSQLIENITSRIQLQNAVEVPLTEKTSADNVDVDNNQLEEITQITEETIDTINAQSATELLKDVQKPNSYGWRTDNEGDVENYNYITDGTSSLNFNAGSKALDVQDYSFKIDPNALGFYGKDSLFFNKEEVENESTNVLPRQMSMPSAPPEEDTKSEGLDVHSIEQDANKDFPIFEEYIIEPESDKTDIGDVQVSDTFTNRVERFKQMEESTEDSNIFLIPKSPVLMASYFDTGNYAVESHYRNIASPILRIPPGFEDEYRKMSLGLKSCIPPMPGVFIPETSTQTRVTTTNTYTMCNQSLGFTVESNINQILEDKQLVENLPTFPTSSTQQNPATEPKESIGINETHTEFTSNFESKEESNASTVLPENTVDSVVNKEEEKRPLCNVAQDLQTLPDPRNFFDVESEGTSTNKEEENSFSRLASYFNASPERPEHSKPFFELSQSQNHYRHESHGNMQTDVKNINSNIPDDRYLANLSLIKDLTSPRNIVVTDTVKTVNFFTVEYDNDFKTEYNKTDKSKENIKYNPNETAETATEQTKPLNNSSNNTDNKTTKDDVNLKIHDCKFCCNFVLHNVTDTNDIKVRKAVNEGNLKSEGSAPTMDSPKELTNKSVTVNLGSHVDDESCDGVDVIRENRATAEYSPVQYHWFYRVDIEDKSTWRGFSAQDSKDLEEAFLSSDLNESTVVATDGGRYDVNIVGRIRTPVYWNDKPTNVRRCSWFYKGTTDARYVPYTEAVAERLEMEYRHGITTGEWHRRLVLPNNELVVMHGPSVMVHFLHTGSTDGFSAPPSASRPRVVRRGHEESEIEDVEPSRVDHLLLLCHGVGSACDMRFRSVEEVVDDFRATSMQLIQSHYNNSYSNGIINRVEVLPISWHSTLHSGETGVDRRLAHITLDSIPRLRSFTNDTVLDVLLYTSPVYCQTIIDTVCKELNRIYSLFKQRNPDFDGGVSLGGHSLGSVILYDLLCHQQPEELKSSSSTKSYVAGSPGTGQPCVKYPELVFSPSALYALGSPIAIFECIRGVEALGMDFALPTCKNFFNIFHPYDPIAYRIEPLINPQLKHVKPYLIPHHKGRKRMHLELKDTMVRVGTDIKQKLIESLRTTWNKWKSSSPPTDGQLEKVVEEEMEKEQLCEDRDESENQTATPDMLGRLNDGRRIDYVLQEAPLEMINEYLFAMTSHVGYWESEDTMLLMLREIYDSMGIRPDSTVPQQTLTVQRTRIANDDSIVTDCSDPSTSRGCAS